MRRPVFIDLGAVLVSRRGLARHSVARQNGPVPVPEVSPHHAEAHARGKGRPDADADIDIDLMVIVRQSAERDDPYLISCHTSRAAREDR